MDIREKMRRDWDRRARVDPRYWVAATEEADEDSYERSGEQDAAALIEGLRGRVGPDARVLDLGCGIGRLTARVARAFARVDGVDVSPEMIDQARRLHGDLDNVAFHVNSGADLAGFADATFDLVFSYAVLPHVPADVVRAYFREVNRVLKPGGWFRFQFWIGEEHPAGANDTLSIRVWSPDALQSLARTSGFALHEIDEIDYVDPVLQLKPAWVNAQRTGAPADGAVGLEGRAATDEPEERALEYGLLLYLAVKRGERGEIDAAEEALEQAVRIDPRRPEAYVQWATHRLERDDVDGARKLFEALVEHVPDCAPGWLYLAQAAALQGDPRGAREALGALGRLKGVDPQVRKDAAALRRRLG